MSEHAPRFPIFVISKGRADICKTSKALTKMGQHHYVVVEPQELALYEKYIDKSNTILVTPFSNLGQGSIPVRNFVLDEAIRMGAEYHWILDDNIQNFYRVNNGRRIMANTSSIFRACEDFAYRYTNVPISGMNYMTFAIPREGLKPFRLNTRVYSCLLIRNDIKHRWRGKYNEDTDICLRVLKDGDCTILFNAFLIDKQATMTMRGGNADIYKESNGRKDFVVSLQRQHPDVVSLVKKWGRWHHHVDYSRFSANKLIRKESVLSVTHTNEYGMSLKRTI
jgi:hypothetical protein